MNKILAVLVVFPSVAFGQTLIDFANGEVADAYDINQNFQELKSAIERIDSQSTILPRDRACTQADLVGQWYQTKGVQGGFEISLSNFFPSGDYVVQFAVYTAAGEEESTVYGTYEFNSNTCLFTLDIVNLPSGGFGVINLDKSVMKLTAGDGSGGYGDYTLILVNEEPYYPLINKEGASSPKGTTGFRPNDFVPRSISPAGNIVNQEPSE